jgi:F-type H+-transporting ATPase subunit a
LKRLVIIGALVYTVATVVLSIFLVKPPRPIIEIRGEPLIQIADFGNEMLNFSITNTLLTAWIITALLIVVCFFATRRIEMIPSGFYNFFESLIEAMYNFITGIAGEKNGRRFFPLVATLFLYITFANWLSLTPIFNTIGIYVAPHAQEEKFHKNVLVFQNSGGINLITPGAEFVKIKSEACAKGEEGENCRETAIEEAVHDKAGKNEKLGVLFPYLRGINTDLMTPLSFALVSLFFIQYWGITALGPMKYASKFINFSSPIGFFVGVLELIAEFARLISFSFRLFGNMLAGEILLLVMTFLVAVCSPILVVFYGLELFVGAIQAFVFGTLTLVFAMGAVTHHGPEGHEEPTAQHH